MAISARHTEFQSGEIILALAHTKEQLYELMDAFTTEGSLGVDAGRIFQEIPDYPIVRSVGFFSAVEAMEKKLKQIDLYRITDARWRGDMVLKLQQHIKSIYRRTE
jgi:hypothetical protein